MDSQREILHNVRSSLACPLCHNLFTSPVLLPCGHVFCSLCIRRHLLSESTCAKACCSGVVKSSYLVPVHKISHAVLCLNGITEEFSPPENKISKRRLLSSNNSAFVRSKLLELGLSASGTDEVMTARYREFTLRWNSNSDAYRPLSKEEIVRQVMMCENDFKNRSPSPTLSDLECIQALEEAERSLSNTPKKAPV